jgi:hypothetical protein
VTDEDKVQGMVGRVVTWADLDEGLLHLEFDGNLMFHIPYDAEYEIEINGDLPN